MVGVADPAESWSAARFVEQADRCVEDILARGRLPVLVGGTGLYLEALIAGRTFARFHGGAPFAPGAPRPRTLGDFFRVEKVTKNTLKKLRFLRIFLDYGGFLFTLRPGSLYFPNNFPGPPSASREATAPAAVSPGRFLSYNRRRSNTTPARTWAICQR